MKNILSEEFDRILHEPRTWLALILSLGFLVYGLRRAFVSEWVPQGFSFADLWYFAYSGSYFTYFIPLAAALPFSDSIVVDRSQGYLRFVFARAPFKTYLRARFLANASVGACVIVIPLFILYLWVNIVAPRSAFPINTWNPAIAGRPEDFWIPLFQPAPDGFILLVTILAGAAGALYANFGLAASLLVHNRYFALGIPFVCFVLADFLAQRTSLLGPKWSPLAAVAGISPNQRLSSSMLGLILSPSMVLLLVILLVNLFGKRQRVLQ